MKGGVWMWRKVIIVVVVIITVLIIAAQIYRAVRLGCIPCLCEKGRPPCLWPQLLLKRFPRLTSQDPTDVTVVTAYFNLSHLETSGSSLSISKYLAWATVFSRLQNPLVVYTDSFQMYAMLAELRKGLKNKTEVILMEQSYLHSFRDVEDIKRVFEDPNYPKFYPDTDIAEYACAQHAKYELVQTTLRRGYFRHTRYIAWLDVGYFRYNIVIKHNQPFYITTPPNMDESKVAMTEVVRPDWSLKPQDVFYNNLVWVGGGMSVARKDVFAIFSEDYQRATDLFMSQGLSSSDQQIIYAMLTPAGNSSLAIRTRIQTYSWLFNDVCYCWFYLGYLCYREV